MGLFLAASGIVNRGSSAVRDAIATYVAKVGGTFEPRAGTTDDPNIAVIQSTPTTSTVLYPDGFSEWDDASSFLSSHLNTPVFSFHIHDGDLWMFIGFDKGHEVAWFNPIPDYWSEVSEDERQKWRGDAKTVAELVPGVNVDSIKNYFKYWGDEPTLESKAYADDQFPIGVDWQLTDFMRRLGFIFPIDESGIPKGETYFFKIRRQRTSANTSSMATSPQDTSSKVLRQTSSKCWWRFW